MHGYTGIWQLKVHVLINVACGMGEVVGDIVGVHVVVVNEAPPILTLWSQVESHIVPVRRPDFVIGVLSVTEVLWQGEWQCTGLKQCHLALEVLILASVVLKTFKHGVINHTD